VSLCVALAVSGHGFGHAVRSAQVASALLARDVRVVVRTDAPAWLFPAGVEHAASPGWPLDVGVAQHDGLELDIDETRRRWLDFGQAFDTRVAVEADLLRHHGVDVLLGDVPPLAFAAAARAGLPSAAVGNFGWDWIYGAWPDFSQPIAHVQHGYRQATLLLRLPLHSAEREAFGAFEHIEDVPLIARHASCPRDVVRAELGLDQDAAVVLLSFGAFDAQGLSLGSLGEWRDYQFVLTPPIASQDHATPPANVHRLVEQPADYISLLAACDVVVTKPGYGIVADCLATRVSVLFTERGPFREYDVLVDALQSLGHARFIPRQDLLAGRLGPYLDALRAEPASWAPVQTDGAMVVAERARNLAAARDVQNTVT
jgi:hypothetical protein